MQVCLVVEPHRSGRRRRRGPVQQQRPRPFDAAGVEVVTAFLAAGVAAGVPELIGEPYADADGTAQLPTLGLPVLVRAGDATTPAACRARAVGRGLPVAVFTAAMFSTGNDHDNRAVVAAARAEELDLVGVALHGPRNAVDTVLTGTTTHP